MKVAPFKLYVDADGCPVINQSLRIAAKRRVESFLICDTAHQLQRHGAETIVVSKGADSADFAIVSRLSPGDLVITQDYGLAAMCLSRKAKVIDQNGMRYTSENIDGLLASRAEAARIRRGGGRLKGPGKRTPEQTEAFTAAFEAMITEAYEDAKSE
ncbi:MAG: YaiI/YqxD family protein [Oscillospiraceae bacterium]|nr:YaiI/YqxD family protein [Oscillospiraceae bacterium]